MKVFLKSSRLAWILVLILLGAAGLVFLPGASGPFIFDDTPNLLRNTYVQISVLTPESLYRAAYSLQAGPLQRPIAMASFALNYYFAGGFDNPTPFKLTNIIIHGLNGLLVFWVVYLVLGRLNQMGHYHRLFQQNPYTVQTLIAGAIALLWIVHPIQITSVLYVVQRMTSLAALFTLLGLICYLQGRIKIVSGRKGGSALALFGPICFGALGVLTKESAVLMPLFIAIMEFTLFHREYPWTRWRPLSATVKGTVMAGLLLAAIGGLLLVLDHVLPGYEVRSFTLAERLLTEARVLFFYLSLLLVPRIDRFGIHHDDIPISISLIEPWTTLPAVAGIVLLLGIALMARRRYPLLSLGILWYFAGHALESTIIPLEIAHEHRNYLASLGLWLVIAHGIAWSHGRLSAVYRAWWLLPILAIAYGGVTVLRSIQWSDVHGLAYYEAQHNPNSADTQNFYGVSLGQQYRFVEAIAAFRRASQLNTGEANYLINMHIAAITAGINLDPTDQEELLQRIANRPYTGSTNVALLTISICIQDVCRSLQPAVIRWMTYLTQNPPPKSDQPFFHHLLGSALAGQNRFGEALTALQKARSEDPKYLHPLIEIVKIHLRRNNILAAERALADLRAANEGNLHPRDEEIAILAGQIEELKKQLKVQPHIAPKQ